MLLAGTALLAALATIVCQEIEFVRTNPLFFRPTQIQYFKGDTNFLLKISVQSPCKSFFENFTEMDWQDDLLIENCNKRFREKAVIKIRNCMNANFEGNATLINSLIPNKANNKRRKTRQVQLQSYAIMGLIAVAGMVGQSQMAQFDDRSIIGQLVTTRNQERDLLDKGEAVFRATRETIEDIQHWSDDIDGQVRKLTNANAKWPHAAALINEYETIFNEYSNIVESLCEELLQHKMSPVVRSLSNETLWEEPASAWSTVYDCYHYSTNETLNLLLRFDMPVRNK